MLFVPRTSLPHQVPSWVPAGSLYFITIHGAVGTAHLTSPEIATGILQSVRYYHDSHRWFARLFLVMPDHVHALISVPPQGNITETVRAWKRYVARQSKVRWQRDFFEHRIRNDENWEEKAQYIRMNPVRKRLVTDSAKWEWVFVGQ